ncbi:T9SS sorting signal type C domain-containing protein [Flavobacterium sp.]|uniref:T9SS sorting signal type C domain-containing protein n=2 Tax=Flavobacterium sp. TaxID=239 RepID=UPI00286B1C3D|nr:T9SS sorting signal type C domain-containing protein [Flavobacterium sp.]
MKTILLSLLMLFAILGNAQCPYPTVNTDYGTTQTFCVDNPNNVINISNINTTKFLLVNVVQGFKYNFSVGDVYAGNTENLNVYNATTNASLVFASGATGASITNWTATYSGQIKIILSLDACVQTNATNVLITIGLVAVGNTFDNQNATGTNTWVGHVYNFLGSSSPGGASPLTPANSIPFDSPSYVGYFNIGTEAFAQAAGNNVCIPVLSNGAALTNLRTETYAIRYKMTSTRAAGCYIVTFRGDDGIRLYNDGVLVFNSWIIQPPTNYNNVLIYLDGSADLVYDYYENDGQNEASFSLTPFNNSSNTVATPTSPIVCSGVTPAQLNGSNYSYNGSTVNPSIAFQWQSSTDNFTFTNISGATNEDYTPPAVTAPTADIIIYYRRVLSAASNSSGCNFASNSVSITTATNAAPVATAGTGITCSQFTANWNAVTNATNYTIDVSTTSSFATFLPGYNNANVGNVTSINITGITTTTVYYRIRAVGSCNTTSYSNVITVNTITTTWNGTAWSNGTPTLSTAVIINGNYDTTALPSFDACSVNVNSPFVVTIVANKNINIQNQLAVATGSTFTVNDDASLVQINNNAVNSGNINLLRNADIRLQDYVYWSSPVENFSLPSVSPSTPSNYFWKWNTTVSNTNGGQGNWQNTSEIMVAAKGYIVRAPSGWNASTPTAFTATFAGKPNSGIITTHIERGSYTTANYSGTNGVLITKFSDNWNLVGNPYPSAISANAFLIANTNIQGAIRIWTHATLPLNTTNPFYNSFAYNYTPNDYIVYNGTGTTSGPTGFNGFIGAGQAFFVVMNDGAATTSAVTFDNAMRNKSYNNSQFYKNLNITKNTENIEKHRIWLDLVSPNRESIRSLIGYVEGATDDDDRMFDAYTSYKPAFNLYSILNDEILSIQGKSLPFLNSDTVPIGIKISTNGTYTIAVAAVDGLFENGNQTIYLEDKILNTVHNLTASPYEFDAIQGIHNDRFLLRYNDATLSNTDFNSLNNTVSVSVLNNDIKINSLQENIKNLVIYDVLGRILISKNNLNVKQFDINTLLKNNQALIVKVILENDRVITKKIVF